MKKMNFFVAFATVVSIGLMSCKEEAVVSSAITIATKDSATITGYVTADLNLQTAGNEAVPAGTSFVVSVPYSALNASATSGKWQKTVSLGADGKYTVKVPSNSSGVSVTISPINFDADQTQTYAAGIPTTTVKSTFSSFNIAVGTLVSGQIKVQNISYSATAIVNPVGMTKVQISGKAQAELDASIIGLENLPDATSIIFTATGWVDSTTVLNGNYTMSVPSGLTVSWRISKLIPTKIWQKDLTTPGTYSYVTQSRQFTITGSNLFMANNLKADISTVTNGTTPAVTSTNTTTTLSGTAQVSNISLAAGTVINFYNLAKTWGASTTVSNTGTYSINVPANDNIFFEYVKSSTTYTNYSFNPIQTTTATTLTSNISGNIAN